MLVPSLHLVLCTALFGTSASYGVRENITNLTDGFTIESQLLQDAQKQMNQKSVVEKTKADVPAESPQQANGEKKVPASIAVNLAFSNSDNAKNIQDEGIDEPHTSRDKIRDVPDKYGTWFLELKKLLERILIQTQQDRRSNSRQRMPQVTNVQYDGSSHDYFRQKFINGSGNLSKSGDYEQHECKSIYSCYDCHTARVCRPLGNGSFQDVEFIKCPLSTPHCHTETGTCSWQASRECLNPDKKFICPADGNFPDVDCKFYHVCTNLTSEKRQCENEEENYNADRGLCDLETKYCGFFDCFQEPPGRKTPYTTFPNYFAYCNGKTDPVIIDKCPDGTWLNVTTQKCEAMCLGKEGVIQDPADYTKYYKCSRAWLTKTEWSMVQERKDCPPGTGFDPKNFMCVVLKDDSSRRTTSLQLRNALKPTPKDVT